MQESGSVPAGGAGVNGAPTTAQSATVVRRPVRRRDPVARWLALTIVVVLILWLAGIVSAIVFGMLRPSEAPRTYAERQLLTTEATVKSGKADPQTYAWYVGTLIDAGQLSKAQEALTQALQTAKKDKSYLLARQAQLQLLNKDFKGAIASADKAMAEAKKELKAYKDANVKAGRKANAGATMPPSYNDAALNKAEAFLGLEDYAGAIKAYGLYLAEEPTASDVLVKRAEAKAKTGDKKGAAADFRTALKYIPDYQPALDGLMEIGASK